MAQPHFLQRDSVGPPSLVGNYDEGAIGEQSDGGVKPGRGGVSICKNVQMCKLQKIISKRSRDETDKI